MPTPMTTGPEPEPEWAGPATPAAGGGIVARAEQYLAEHPRPSPNPRTVWRFALPITDRHALSMPGFPAILHVAPSRLAPNELDLWAVVEPGAPRQDHEILVVGTGNPLPADAGRHVGSCITHGGDAVWHVFEVLR